MKYINISVVIFKIMGWLRFAILGIRIKHVKHSIYDFFPDYKTTQEGVSSGVVISNHSSFLDVFVLFQKRIAFLSKASIAKAPIFGGLAIDRQSVFVNRDDAKNKNAVIDKLKKRADLSSQGRIHPLCVFPEGTVSNGRSIMKFKKGAFMSDKPIRVMSMKYGGDLDFSGSMSNINILTCFAFTLSQPYITLEIHELDQDFDPAYSFTSRGIKNEGEDAWKYVAEDTKSIMSFMTGYESTEQGFTELKKCEVLQDSLVLGVEFGFRDSRTEKKPGFLCNNERKYWEVSPAGELIRKPRKETGKK
jgi:1-acyl-sn-glycerol-3-phosphate acyltransferase